MHLYLTILVNLIIKNYFNDSNCIVHYHDDSINLVHIDRTPTIARRILGKNNLLLDQHKKCRHFLLQSTNARLAFESTEDVINTNSFGMYNDRKYIIIVDSQETFIDFFNTSILTFVRDVLVIYASNEKDNGLKEIIDMVDDDNSIAEYDLFTHKYVGLGGYNDAVLLDTWYTRNLSFKFGNSLYPDKVTDLQGRELRAMCFGMIPYAVCNSDLPSIGNEHNIIVNYAERFNMTLKSYLNDSIDYGHIYPNGTSEGALAGLLLNDTDYCEIVYGGFRKYEHIDLIKSVIFTYEVSVPIPNIKYGYFMFLEVFDLHLLLSICLLYILLVGLVYMHRQVMKYSTKSIRSESTNLAIYGLLINQPTQLSHDFKERMFLKYLLIIMLFSGVLLSTAYNSRLASVLVTPIFENDINTLSELATSNLRLLFFDRYYDVLENDERLVVARYRRSNGEYFERSVHLLQMYGKYKPITPELYTNYYCILLRKNSMHTYELYRLKQTADEAGLMRFWEEDALRIWMETTFQQRMREVPHHGNENVNLLHLKGIFAFWGLGLVISFIAFLIEMFREKKHFTCYKFYD